MFVFHPGMTQLTLRHACRLSHCRSELWGRCGALPELHVPVLTLSGRLVKRQLIHDEILRRGPDVAAERLEISVLEGQLARRARQSGPDWI
jgi:hypothetical protein